MVMAESKSKELQVERPHEVLSPEETKSGLVYTPSVDIFETDAQITVLADMPGVKADRLRIDLRDNVLTLSGQVDPPEHSNEVDIMREYRAGSYVRRFNLSEVIDQSRIEATLTDGVLHLTLPKMEPAVPRKIEVKTG
jgi:HSP20 family molecular chaperone IbpA